MGFPCADVANATGWLTSVTPSLETVWTAGNIPRDPTVKGKRGLWDQIVSIKINITTIYMLKVFFCSRCEDGYVGDPVSGEPCEPCLCPDVNGSGRFFAIYCNKDPFSGTSNCECLPGHTGPCSSLHTPHFRDYQRVFQLPVWCNTQSVREVKIQHCLKKTFIL